MTGRFRYFIRKAAYILCNSLIKSAIRTVGTGPRNDRLLDYLRSWQKLQYRPRIRSPRTLNEIILESKYDFEGDMALARRVTDKVQFRA